MQLLPSLNKDLIDLAKRAVTALEAIAEHLGTETQCALCARPAAICAEHATGPQ